MNTIRIGTRGSALALVQTELVRNALLARWPNISIDVQILRTSGDIWSASSPEKEVPTPGKGFFTREFEEALVSGKIDLAVHSLKDLPTDDHLDLVIAAIPERADSRDILITKTARGLRALPQNAAIATGSKRRCAQLLKHRADLRIADIRGNIDTRLRKLRENPEWEGILLAAAGLDRLKPALEGLIVTPLAFDEMLPAPGQGALALQTRRDDGATRHWIAALDHAPTRAAVTAERAFLAALGGGCQAPVGALAESGEGILLLRGIAWIGNETAARTRSLAGAAKDAEAIGKELARQVLAQ